MNNKYLYYYVEDSTKVFRYPISRETNSSIWLQGKNSGGTYEIKVSKKTYRYGNGYNATLFYDETPELKLKWRETQMKLKFKAKLKLLETCTDVSIMEQILSIVIPEELK